MKAVTVPARLEDAFVLHINMRAEDVRELSVYGQTPLEVVLGSMRVSSMSRTLLLDDELGAMWGVRSLTSLEMGAPTRGQLWFLTTHLFGKKPAPFIRAIRKSLVDVMDVYDELVNHIDGRYTGALQFAAAMGACFGSPVPVGPERVPFIPFTIRRN